MIHGRSPGVALSMLAEEHDAAAIVVGSAHHAGHGFAVMGGVARQLFGNSPCSVAAAPRGYRKRAPEHFARLLAAYVGTDEGLDALRIAGELADAGRARLRVVSVVDMDGGSLMPGRPRGDSRRAACERDLDRALCRLASAVAVDGVVIAGDPVACLLEQAASGVDLIITGSRGFGVARLRGRAASGSPAKSFSPASARRSSSARPVPVLVVPRGGDRDPVAAALRPTGTSRSRALAEAQNEARQG